jgi:hypothetical protein
MRIPVRDEDVSEMSVCLLSIVESPLDGRPRIGVL